MQNNRSLSIGIPTYNAEANISSLIKQLLDQKLKRHTLKEIIIHSDMSTDQTDTLVKKISDPRVKLIAKKRRQGFAAGVEWLIQHTDSDILVLLNDDIYIPNQSLLEKLINPFEENSQVGLVSGNPQPLPPRNWFQQAELSTFRAYETCRLELRQGHNKYTCDGKVLACSRSFLKKLNLPAQKEKMGNVDTYLYFACLDANFIYQHASQAVVHFELPETISDYISWDSRNRSNKIILEKTFGDLVAQEYHIPAPLYFTALLSQVIKNPLGSLFIFLLGKYNQVLASKLAQSFETTWPVVTSTKKSLSSK